MRTGGFCLECKMFPFNLIGVVIRLTSGQHNAFFPISRLASMTGPTPRRESGDSAPRSRVADINWRRKIGKVAAQGRKCR
jgi:hypothetical protein